MIKRILKFILISLLTSIMIGIAWLIIAAVVFLPSPAEIAQKLNSLPHSSPATADTQPIEPSIAENETSTAAHNSGSNEQNAAGPASDPEAEKKSKEFVTIRKMLDEDPRDLRVCRNLGRSNLVGPGKDVDEDQSFKSILNDDAREDSLAEGYRYAVRTIFQDEAVAPLMKEIMDVKDAQLADIGKNSAFDKVRFYAKTVQAAASLYAKKSKFEDMGNRVSHLAMVAKIAAMKPELANDSNLVAFCDTLQSSIVNAETIDIKAERKEILALIASSGLTPKDLNFDPDSYIKFQINSSENNFTFSFSSKNSN